MEDSEKDRKFHNEMRLTRSETRLMRSFEELIRKIEPLADVVYRTINYINHPDGRRHDGNILKIAKELAFAYCTGLESFTCDINRAVFTTIPYNNILLLYPKETTFRRDARLHVFFAVEADRTIIEFSVLRGVTGVVPVQKFALINEHVPNPMSRLEATDFILQISECFHPYLFSIFEKNVNPRPTINDAPILSKIPGAPRR